MQPHIVEEAPMPPGQCLFSQDIEGPWIDTGLVAPWIRPYGYLSVNYVESLARELLGMVPAREVNALKERLDSYEGQIKALQSFVEANENLEQAKEGAI